MDTTLITCTGLLVLMLAAWQFVRSRSGEDKSIPTEWMVSIGRIANDQALGHHRDARRGALQVIHALKRSPAGSPVAHHVRIRLAGLLAKDPVYPEVVHGNILDLSVVARWILNKPGHLGGEASYDDNEILFYWDDWMIVSEIKAEKLQVPIIDQRVFNAKSKPAKTTGICY